MAYRKTSSNKKNNFTGTGPAASTEDLVTNSSRFDFTLHWTGADGALGAVSFPDVSLKPLVNIGSTTYALEVYLWSSFAYVPTSAIGGYPVLGIKRSAGTIPGTVKEHFYKYSDPIPFTGDAPMLTGITQTEIATRDNVDPGFGDFRIFDTDPVDAGRPGPRYSFVVASDEYRIHAGGTSPATIGQKPIAVVPNTVPGGIPFPLTLVMTAGSNQYVRNIAAGDATTYATVFSGREQVALLGSLQTKLYLRFYQAGRITGIDGLPLDVETPTIT